MAFGDFFKKKEGEEDKKEDEEPKGPPTAGYRGLWGDNGMMALFWAMITFPLGFVGMILLSPTFVFVVLLSFVLFITGVVLIEMEQREPEVPDHEWSHRVKIREDPPEEEKKGE